VTSSSPTREPQQSRSRSTVARILAAADREIGEVGPSAASTTSIARRAGVSVGGLYRFFADKEAIFDALAELYLQDVSTPYAEVLDTLSGPGDFGAAIGELVERASALQLDHPGYYRLTEERSPDRLDSPAHRVRERLILQFVAGLERAGIDVPADEAHRVLDLCLETVRHTLVRAPASGSERLALIEELKRMLVAYVTQRFE